MKIEAEQNCCTVVVTVDGDPADVAAIIAHATEGLTHFQGYDGFIGGATHLSVDKRRLVQYLQWQDQDSYATCQDDPAWQGMKGSKRLMELLASGRLKLKVDIFEVIAQRG